MTERLAEQLPNDICERVRRVGQSTQVAETGRFVLLWLHNALRVENNPAVNAAVLAANKLDLPLLVYQGVSERYPFASDRHHSFILEGARDLAQQCQHAGLPFVCHVERRSDRRPHLRELASGAALVVTDDIPTAPARGWIDRLAEQTNVPLWAVDASCVVPMTRTNRAYTRAFEFRKSTRKDRKARLDSCWVAPRLNKGFDPAEALGFEPIDVANAEFARLIGDCDIDHSIGPVPHTRGGTTAARQRWHDFRGKPLERYAVRRNDALVDGVSRMSAYLHYGMISTFELVSDALEAGAGGEKYLDELLIWRELAWHFCAHTPDHESVNTLPAWARETLQKHERDPRPALLGWETLARGQTGDALWDAAQQSLLRHGELHNNVRMTWGKALLNWTESPEKCLVRLIDLNHRYALDGRDPSSFGGLLWCLGQFDRPFAPEEPIVGTVRPRDTATHARRLPPDKYHERAIRPLKRPVPRVAVVGGGITGLMAARTLQDHGFDVTVFDRGRRVGGRTASRETGHPSQQFDYGAPVLHPSDFGDCQLLESWEREGLVRAWEPNAVHATTNAAGRMVDTNPLARDSAVYVAQPDQNAVARHLVDGLNVQCDCEIERVTETAEEALLTAQSRVFSFDRVVVAMPPEQASRLLGDLLDISALSRPAHVALLRCSAVLQNGADWIELENDVFLRLIREGAKPGRTGNGDSWAVMTTPVWSSDRLEADREQLAEELAVRFGQLFAVDPAFVKCVHVHRWTFAQASSEPPGMPLVAGRIAVAGDWIHGSTIMDAVRAGQDAAGVILRAELIAGDPNMVG